MYDYLFESSCNVIIGVARSIPNLDVHVLPVFIKTYQHSDTEDAKCNRIVTQIYTQTESYLNFILGDELAIERDTSL